MKLVRYTVIFLCIVLTACSLKRGASHEQYKEAQMMPVMQVPVGYVKPFEPSYPIPALKSKQPVGKAPSLLPPGINEKD